MGHLFTFEMSIREDHRLVTDGPYAWIRHPGYTSVLCTFMGLGIWHATKVGRSGQVMARAMHALTRPM